MVLVKHFRNLWVRPIDLLVLSNTPLTCSSKSSLILRNIHKYFLVRAFFYQIAIENNIKMMGFISFLWEYNFLCLFQRIRIETHFLLMNPCFNFFQVVINFICRGIQMAESFLKNNQNKNELNEYLSLKLLELHQGDQIIIAPHRNTSLSFPSSCSGLDTQVLVRPSEVEEAD